MAERLTARKAGIGELLAGQYRQKEGIMPNHIVTERGDVSRANLIAALVDKPAATAIILDDGSGRIEARAFDDTALFADLMVGDIILLIGRPREYRGQRYLVAEIAKRLGGPTWLQLRKAELARERGGRAQEKAARRPSPEERKAAPAETAAAETGADALLATIRRLDDGSGAPIERVLAEAGCEESALTGLMAEGEIFEIRPGRVKVLE